MYDLWTAARVNAAHPTIIFRRSETHTNDLISSLCH